MKLTFLGRVGGRWRVRVDLPPGIPISGLTLGLFGDDGRALCPQIVAPGGEEGCFIAELGGPCTLPHGTVVTCVADLADGRELRTTTSVDRRRGLHAFLHGDAKLPLVSRAEFESLTSREQRRIGHSFPWVSTCRTCSAPVAANDDDLMAMLREEFDVDPDDLDEDLLSMLGRGDATG